MKQKIFTSLVALFLVSIFFNISLFIKVKIKDFDIGMAKEMSESYATQRDLLADLIPALKPKTTKAELVDYIKEKYPDELVDELDDHVQWRIYQFWFEKGQISAVQVGS